ncbi:hypothetical protein WMF38_00445 [Sorangium sp. So ce118]
MGDLGQRRGALPWGLMAALVVRWLMSPSCPLCSATAPSLTLLDERYRERGLAVIGMYHHKDPEPLEPEEVRGRVAHFGYVVEGCVQSLHDASVRQPI